MGTNNFCIVECHTCSKKKLIEKSRECLNHKPAAPMAEWLKTLIFSALNHSSSHRCGFEPSSGHM